MNRRDFIKTCKVLGIGAFFQPSSSVLASNAIEMEQNNETVIIIGAGAAGLSVGYLLSQMGVPFKIVEALSSPGGRMKRTTEFADFPIPLGAEWIHAHPTVLKEIVNDNAVDLEIKTTRYDSELEWALYDGEVISIEEAGFAEDSKFVGATWFDFFDRYILPSVESNIHYNTVVKSIDYLSEKIRVQSSNEVYTADRVVVTVPPIILKNKAITFTPLLPQRKRNAINRITTWDGFKAFIEFSEKFYPAIVEFNLGPFNSGEKLYYDAAYGQDTSQNVLGFFAVGSGAHPYVDLHDDNSLISYMLKEIDELSNGKASSSYIKHIFQNWSVEPYAQGAYIGDDESWRLIRTLGQNVENRIFFAGDGYTDGEDWGSVHTAAQSARRAIEEMNLSGLTSTKS